MKRMIGLLMVVGLWSGCGGDSDSPTAPTKGPEGQTLEIKTEEWDNGNIKVEFQFYRDGGSVVKHGWYKAYGEDGTIFLDGTYFEGKSDDVNPLTSGEWRDSSECGGYSEEEVSEFWNEVEKSGRSAEFYEAEADLNSDNTQPVRAAMLHCYAWLAGNR